MKSTTNRHTKIFEENRPLLFSIAYRMLGSVMDAEDVIFWFDGGGKARAARRLLIDNHEIANLLAVSARKSPANVKAQMFELNGHCSLMYRLRWKSHRGHDL
ncbi:hypothetical protein MJD09_05630 [bacterium]|nr:hypothetical protein [bacterium]